MLSIIEKNAKKVKKVAKEVIDFATFLTIYRGAWISKDNSGGSQRTLYPRPAGAKLVSDHQPATTDDIYHRSAVCGNGGCSADFRIQPP